MKNYINVLIAEDHTIVRNGIVALLEKEEDIKVIAEAKDGKDVLSQLASGIEPDIILTDINMPDMSGLALIERLKTDYPNIKVVVLTMLEHEKYVNQALKAGAKGFLLKNVNIDEIIFALKQVVKGYPYVCTGISLNLLSKVDDYNSNELPRAKTDIEISKREVEILRLIAQGFTNSEIADKLFTSKRTIEGNRQNLLDKTGTKNTAALVNFVVRNRIID